MILLISTSCMVVITDLSHVPAMKDVILDNKVLTVLYLFLSSMSVGLPSHRLLLNWEGQHSFRSQHSDRFESESGQTQNSSHILLKGRTILYY
jgi:hypothetical protein